MTAETRKVLERLERRFRRLTRESLTDARRMKRQCCAWSESHYYGQQYAYDAAAAAIRRELNKGRK